MRGRWPASGRPAVMARQGNMMALSFHPELTSGPPHAPSSCSKWCDKKIRRSLGRLDELSQVVPQIAVLHHGPGDHDVGPGLPDLARRSPRPGCLRRRCSGTVMASAPRRSCPPARPEERRCRPPDTPAPCPCTPPPKRRRRRVLGSSRGIGSGLADLSRPSFPGSTMM